MKAHTKEIMKHVDEQGRVVIPKKWRNEYLKDTSTVILQIRDGEIIMKSHQPVDITKYFNSLDAGIEADLDNWDDVKRELLKKGHLKIGQDGSKKDDR